MISSGVVKRVPASPRPWRVYTRLAGLALLLLGPAACGPAPATLDIDPAMVKGSPRAPVTIVEFSDYQ
ncbi:MAG TPA: hypothetical protein VNN07_02530 [Candidatus Tectomicrobia bacterium]|nr:hypothetical protein [Candidatus Tectomicrobia bacterium]